MRKLVIFGTGLIAEVAAFYFRSDSGYAIVAFTNAEAFIKEDVFQGIPVVPFETLEKSHAIEAHDLFIAIGYQKTNQVRQRRFVEAQKKGYSLATYVSSRAAYYGTSVGGNCLILENNVIQPFVEIGDNVTLWSGNHIGHHTRIRDHCFISSHVVVSGGCHLDENCFLGVNSTLRDNVRLGKFCVVASGAVVMKDCEDRTVVQAPESTYRVIKRDVI